MRVVTSIGQAVLSGSQSEDAEVAFVSSAYFNLQCQVCSRCSTPPGRASANCSPPPTAATTSGGVFSMAQLRAARNLAAARTSGMMSHGARVVPGFLGDGFMKGILWHM